MSEEKVKFGSGLFGTKIIVYNNRVEVVTGCFPLNRKRIILIRDITNVTVSQTSSESIIHITGGKQIGYSMENYAPILGYSVPLLAAPFVVRAFWI